MLANEHPAVAYAVRLSAACGYCDRFPIPFRFSGDYDRFPTIIH